ncbi:hypothetical protein EYR38_006779 [Pleurotus pulmonarius]|nr:hypothetical protein EYR38_006779 [Pleurotus pulmonarius]
MSLSRQRRSGSTQAPIGVYTTAKQTDKVVVSVDPVSTKGSRRNAQVLAAVACLAGLSWFASSPPRNTVPASELAETYALCTPDGPKIYTVDELRPNVQCLVVQGAFIVGTGNLSEIQRRHSSKSNLVVRHTKPGTIIIPGLSDSHGHILEYGASRELLLDGAASVQDVVARVREYVLANQDVYKDTTRYILGGGWDHTFWPLGGWPSAEDLEADSILKGRPIVLQSKDCHALWLSPKAVESSLPFPDAVDGGVIVRDKLGKPTGVFLDNAQELVKQPPVTEADLSKRFKSAVKDAHRFGLTSIHDAGLDPISLKFFKRQAGLGDLPIRVYGMTYFNENEAYWGNTSTPDASMGRGRLTARSVKIFADGALRTGGAALYEPYTDDPSTNGFMRLSADTLSTVIGRFLRDGWQVNVHAIGDRANGLVLDSFEAALEGVNVTALRPRLEHAQLMTKADMQRLGKLGVIASVQPTHVISDMWYAESKLGAERVKGLYAFRDIIASGARLTLGSDFPVEDMNPMGSFYAAITRTSLSGESPHGHAGWFPDQRLSRAEALRGLTIDPAYASFSDHELGSLVAGKRADYVVLSQDIMTVPTEDLLDTKVVATAIDGTVVYGSL